jgi:hypothetical protein
MCVLLCVGVKQYAIFHVSDSNLPGNQGPQQLEGLRRHFHARSQVLPLGCLVQLALEVDGGHPGAMLCRPVKIEILMYITMRAWDV